MFASFRGRLGVVLGASLRRLRPAGSAFGRTWLLGGALLVLQPAVAPMLAWYRVGPPHAVMYGYNLECDGLLSSLL